MPRLQHRWLPMLGAVFVLFLVGANPTMAATCPSPADTGALRMAVLDLVNAERARGGLPALGASQPLTQAAQSHACYLARRDALTHRGPFGQSLGRRLRREGYALSRANENLALGQTSPAQTVGSWMASPGHRANILMSGMRDFGLGVAVTGSGRLVWVMVSARPR